MDKWLKIINGLLGIVLAFVFITSRMALAEVGSETDSKIKAEIESYKENADAVAALNYQMITTGLTELKDAVSALDDSINADLRKAIHDLELQVVKLDFKVGLLYTVEENDEEN